MSSVENRFTQLFEQYVRDACNKEELQELLGLINSTSEETVRNVCYQHWTKTGTYPGISDADTKLEQMLASLRVAAPIADLKPADNSNIKTISPAHRVRFLKTEWFKY